VLQVLTARRNHPKKSEILMNSPGLIYDFFITIRLLFIWFGVLQATLKSIQGVCSRKPAKIECRVVEILMTSSCLFYDFFRALATSSDW
jgi:hypothetical protein